MASQIATGISTAVVVSTIHANTAIAVAPSSGRIRSKARRYAASGPIGAPGVELDERARRRRLDEREPEERQRRADHERQERAATRHLSGERSDEVEQLEDRATAGA